MRDEHKENNSRLRCVKPGPRKQDTDFHVHAYASIAVDAIHATIRTRSTVLASLGSLVQVWVFHLLCHLWASNTIFGPQKSCV